MSDRITRFQVIYESIPGESSLLDVQLTFKADIAGAVADRISNEIRSGLTRIACQLGAEQIIEANINPAGFPAPSPQS